ncbi:hypothetical protein [Nocardioides humi]|uniref:PRC-barrel domain-containing protein n=1 Tax=Nocardioides humi TaxID=449461 RepID=A0ABN2AXI8_9ACTN|nr:hypothetical protein [Nocardioides humi]
MVSLTERDGYDVGLHLLDRQVVTSDGRLAGKVDDIELLRGEDGTLTPTALLTGLPALLPRFDLSVRALPRVIDLDLIEDVDSEVRLTVPGPDPSSPMEPARATDPRRLRVSRVLGLPVRCAVVPRRSKVLDLRMLGSPCGPGEHRVTALIVGPGRPGALFGYDRRSEPGPAAVAAVVRRLHRHARVVDLDDAVELDLDAGEVRIGPGASLRPLRG